MRMRRRAVRALMSHTQNAIRDLRNDEDEMLRGRAWPLGLCSQEASNCMMPQLSSFTVVRVPQASSDHMPGIMQHI